jgi:ribonuclease P protein component
MNHYGFPQQVRLLTAGDYRNVFDGVTCKVSNRHILLLARERSTEKNSVDKNISLQHPRVGLVFAKKNVRLAVQRNRLKRLVRESFRLHQHKLEPLDIVVLSRPGISELDNQTVTKQLEKLWQRLNKRAIENKLNNKSEHKRP